MLWVRFGRDCHAFILSDALKVLVRLGVVLDHPLRKRLHLIGLGLLLGERGEVDFFGDAVLRDFFNKILVGFADFGRAALVVVVVPYEVCA